MEICKQKCLGSGGGMIFITFGRGQITCYSSTAQYIFLLQRAPLLPNNMLTYVQK